MQSSYDFASLQEKILDRFIAGRTLLKAKVCTLPHLQYLLFNINFCVLQVKTVVYVDDYTSTMLFTQLRNVVKQVCTLISLSLQRCNEYTL
jgi:hypothetical protein